MLHIINNTSGVFTLYVYVNSGSIYEDQADYKGIDKKPPGIAHFLEHMVFKRSKDMTGKQVLEESTRIGANLNAATDKDTTFFYIKTPTANYKHAINLMASILVNPVFSKNDIDVERNVVIEEFMKTQDNSDKSMWNLAYMSVFAEDNPYMYSVIGTKDSLQSITIEQLRRCYKSMYGSYDIIVNCEKGVEKDVAAIVSRAFAPKLGVAPTRQPDACDSLERKVYAIQDTTNQFQVSVTFPFAIDVTQKTLVTIEFISFVLTGARLYSTLIYELREKRGLIYSASSYVDTMRHVSIFNVFLSSSSKDILGLLSVVVDHIKRFSKKGVHGKRLRFYKSAFINTLKMNMIDPDYCTMVAGTALTTAGIKVTPHSLLEEAGKITASDVLEMCKRVLDFDKAGVVVVGPLKKDPTTMANSIMELLAR